jgi:hypothetical protein
MVQPTLYDFAEAALGHSSDMRWSLNAEITQRQVSPLLARCKSHEVTSLQATEAAMDVFRAKMLTIREVLASLYEALRAELGEEGESFPAVIEFDELFMGLNSSIEWASNAEVLQDEIEPLFERCYSGGLDIKSASALFTDSVVARKNYYLEVVQNLTRNLALQMSEDGHPELAGRN